MSWLLHQFIRYQPGWYLHKEIALAIDVAERQPEGAIYKFRCTSMNARCPSDFLAATGIPRDMVAEIYVTLQSSLLNAPPSLGELAIQLQAAEAPAAEQRFDFMLEPTTFALCRPDRAAFEEGVASLRQG